MFHAISRVFSTCPPGTSPIIDPPQSLTTYPALTKRTPGPPPPTPASTATTPDLCEMESTLDSALVDDAAGDDFPPVETKLDLEAMFTIAIDENKARLTIARATLETYVSATISQLESALTSF